MPITITKAKTKAKSFAASLPQVEDTGLEASKMKEAQLADTYGQLKDYTDAVLMDPAFDRLKEVGAEIMSRVSDLPKTDAYTMVGSAWVVTAEGGKTSNKRSIVDMAKLREFVGDDVFMSICTVLLKDVDKYLTPEQIAQVCEVAQQVGPRKLTTKQK